MPTTQEIMVLATELGKQLAKHEAVVRFESVLKKFQDDVEAQRLFNDYHRQVAKIGQNEAQGTPIEVDDKRRLESLQQRVVDHPILRDLQIKQMDYLDLMRRLDQTITDQTSLGGLSSAPGLEPSAAGEPPA